MLSRSTIRHDQENQVGASSTSLHRPTFPTKTPARQQQQRAGPTTGGKGLFTTNKTSRVLGTKDKNASKGGSNGQGGSNGSASKLLFAKPKASTSSSSCVASTSNSFLSPTPAASTVQELPIHLRTPSPGLRRMQSLNMLQMLSPEAAEPEIEVSPDQGERESRIEAELRGEIDVELAGASSRDYEEPIDLPSDWPDFATAKFGPMIRSLSFAPPPPEGGFVGKEEEWEKEDREWKCDIVEDMGLQKEMKEETGSIFPVLKKSHPTATRKPLVNKKTSNTPLSKAPLRRALPASSTSTSTLRKPLLSTLTKSRVPASTSRPTPLLSARSRPTPLPLRMAKSSASSLTSSFSASAKKVVEPEMKEEDLGVFGVVGYEAGVEDLLEGFGFEDGSVDGMGGFDI